MLQLSLFEWHERALKWFWVRKIRLICPSAMFRPQGPRSTKPIYILFWNTKKEKKSDLSQLLELTDLLFMLIGNFALNNQYNNLAIILHQTKKISTFIRPRGTTFIFEGTILVIFQGIIQLLQASRNSRKNLMLAYSHRMRLLSDNYKVWKDMNTKKVFNLDYFWNKFFS